ncbi:MAG: hypothetical protein ABFS56_15275 [Pseudomonadota bacterium]
MPTLMINIETNLLHQAKIYAALQGISISQIIKGDLVKMTKAIDKTPELDRVRTILKRYSEDQLSRKETMALLEADYGKLIMMMADNHLPLPILPEPEIKKMAATFSKIWRSS